MTADRILLEVCVDTPAGLAAAIAGGADRIELCAALALQGLTPAPGLMAQAAKAPIPIYPMIRPRNGDFCYDAGDLDHMRRDIDAVREYGLAGVVIGANLPDGQLDLDALEMLVEHSQGLGLSLHRAFDLVPEQSVALEAAIALGFERVLTSGGALTAQAGAERIAELGATLVAFPNGVKLTVKPTTFAHKQILISVRVGGGPLAGETQELVRATVGRWLMEAAALDVEREPFIVEQMARLVAVRAAKARAASHVRWWAPSTFWDPTGIERDLAQTPKQAADGSRDGPRRPPQHAPAPPARRQPIRDL